ncbi:hypothetical protein [Flavobacterium sp. ASW18X]|uniref:hypothetical protein n=1 Tax=Flavobacterium sp. ASW18X TaxID=2572595 RepID=UPI0010AE4E58|nr:hypothetical protein [Flavobacterium sp. ASW18X]TKD59335.1 hypothetical protein FBT53_13350 [Flavobacterium sp. ASW18X]
MEIGIMLIGFLLAGYAVVANDVIQTLGTFIVSNKAYHWSLLWGFAGVILTLTLVYSWYFNGGDVSYQRLDKIPLPERLHWSFLLAPLALLILTRLGMPVSTTFLILSVFSSQQFISQIVLKSVLGYAIAFVTAFILYLIVSKFLESKTSLEKVENLNKNRFWLIAQWCTTGFLWSQWLIQDFANIFVFLPRKLSILELFLALVFILFVMALIFKQRGGKIQEIVAKKTNTQHIRSATIIDLLYALLLFFYGNVNSVPMSTTWTFIGLLAGRELAITFVMHRTNSKAIVIMVRNDLFKALTGLLVSIGVVYFIKYLVGM